MVEQQEANGSLPKPRRRWVRTGLLGLVILLCGMIIGGALTLHFRWPRLLLARQPWERMPEHIADRMREELGLTEEQQKEIQTILAKHHGAMESIRVEVQPRVEAQIDSMRREIDAVLTPEQARRWTERFEKMRRHWPPGGPRRPPGSERPRDRKLPAH